MNISIIGTAGIPANYGGFETITENLVTHLSVSAKIICRIQNTSYTIIYSWIITFQRIVNNQINSACFHARSNKEYAWNNKTLFI
jgi:hypothetical protein